MLDNGFPNKLIKIIFSYQLLIFNPTPFVFEITTNVFVCFDSYSVRVYVRQFVLNMNGCILQNFERAVPKIRDYSNTRIRDGSGSRLNKSNSETNPYFHLSNEPYSNICNHNVGLKLKARNKSLDRYSSFEQDVCSEENDTIK